MRYSTISITVIVSVAGKSFQPRNPYTIQTDKKLKSCSLEIVFFKISKRISNNARITTAKLLTIKSPNQKKITVKYKKIVILTANLTLNSKTDHTPGLTEPLKKKKKKTNHPQFKT